VPAASVQPAAAVAASLPGQQPESSGIVSKFRLLPRPSHTASASAALPGQLADEQADHELKQAKQHQLAAASAGPIASALSTSRAVTAPSAVAGAAGRTPAPHPTLLGAAVVWLLQHWLLVAQLGVTVAVVRALLLYGLRQRQRQRRPSSPAKLPLHKPPSP